MSRIVLPNNSLGWRTLSKSIFDRHILDATASCLLIYFDENKIVIADVVEALKDANLLDVSHGTFAGESEFNNAEYLRLFTPAFDAMQGGVQNLKSLFVTNPRKLEGWGINIDNKSKVVFPPDFLSRKEIFYTFYKKHISFTTPPSPLTPWLVENNIDLPQLKSDTDDAVAAYNLFSTDKGQKENVREQRDVKLTPNQKIIKNICDYLKKHYSTNPQNLTRYGIEVDSSPQAPVEKEYQLANVATKTVNKIKMNSNLINTGGTILFVYKGKIAQGNNVSIQPGNQIKITRGNSTVTIQNSNVTPPFPPKDGGTSGGSNTGSFKVTLLKH